MNCNSVLSVRVRSLWLRAKQVLQLIKWMLFCKRAFSALEWKVFYTNTENQIEKKKRERERALWLMQSEILVHKVKAVFTLLLLSMCPESPAYFPFFSLRTYQPCSVSQIIICLLMTMMTNIQRNFLLLFCAPAWHGEMQESDPLLQLGDLWIHWWMKYRSPVQIQLIKIKSTKVPAFQNT